MWRHSLNNWEKVDKDVYKFCFEQGEKRLKDVLDDGEKITNRVYALIGIIIPVISVSASVILNAITKKSPFDLMLVISISATLTLGVCLFYLSRLIKKRDVWFSGTEPRDIVQTQYLEIETLEGDEAIKFMYVGELESIQHKIEQNKVHNEERIKSFTAWLNMLVIATVIALSAILSKPLFD